MSDPTLKATVCPHCGAPAAPGESFCRNCGKQLFAPTMTAPPPVVPQRQASPYPPPMPPPIKKGRSKLMMGCLDLYLVSSWWWLRAGGHLCLAKDDRTRRRIGKRLTSPTRARER